MQRRRGAANDAAVSLDATYRLVAGPEGLLTLGSDPTCLWIEPRARYRALWQLPGRDSRPLATTSRCRIYVSTFNSGRTRGSRYGEGRPPKVVRLYQRHSEREQQAVGVVTRIGFSFVCRQLPIQRIELLRPCGVILIALLRFEHRIERWIEHLWECCLAIRWPRQAHRPECAIAGPETSPRMTPDQNG